MSTINGYPYNYIDGRIVYEHVAIVEQAAGRKMQKGEQVHHVDFSRDNNASENLVACPNAAYHRLLHRRAEALKVCGNANWMKCRYCSVWDSPQTSGVVVDGRHMWHRVCAAAYRKAQRRQ